MTGSISINRMAVYRHKNTLYDQVFHRGVNIIHGSNGSGKSTLAEFIFFGLGGDVKDWREYAGMAEFVMLEIAAGDAVMTLRREVTTSTARPMSIHFGNMADALNAGPTQWESFPYARPKAGYSFSQVVFRASGIPESVSEGSSNITIHQVLRLLYSDQLSPVQRIFRVENFDPWQIRQAVGNLLCGLGGYDLFDKQIELREVEEKHKDVSQRLRNLTVVAASYGKDVLAEHIEAAIRNTGAEREALSLELQSALDTDDAGVTEPELDKARSKTRSELARARRDVANLEDQAETLQYEIEDADSFLLHLEAALNDFDAASATFFSLGMAKFEFCPTCFAPTSDSDDPDTCHLCGSRVIKPEEQSKALAVRLDLEMQIRESRQLQEDRNVRFASLSNALRAAKLTLRQAQTADEVTRRTGSTPRDTKVSDLSRRIGFLERELQSLQQRLDLSREIERLTNEKAELNGSISKLKDAIEALTQSQARRRAEAYTRIVSNTKAVLELDLKDQNDFGEINDLTFDFAGDWIAINGNKNRAGSASGMVILKNSFLLGMLLSSLEDDAFNLPRFMLFDNIEDKGMIQERSWNFQRLIISETEKRSRPHQVIFTTSKIAPELEDTAYVVGRKYTREHPCLEFARN